MNKEDRLFKAMIDGHISEEQYLRGEEIYAPRVGDYVVKDDSWTLKFFGSNKGNVVVQIIRIDVPYYYFDTGTHMSGEMDGSVRLRLATPVEIQDQIIRRGLG